jgi:hypothetical protein
MLQPNIIRLTDKKLAMRLGRNAFRPLYHSFANLMAHISKTPHPCSLDILRIFPKSNFIWRSHISLAHPKHDVLDLALTTRPKFDHFVDVNKMVGDTMSGDFASIFDHSQLGIINDPRLSATITILLSANRKASHQ